MSTLDDDGGFVIFSGRKLWYTSKEGLENTLCKPKTTRNMVKVRNSAKNKRIVENEIFDKVMKNETDPFWITFFDDAAIGKFPRNCKYTNGCLIYRAKNKNIEISVSEDPETASSDVKKFLLENAGIQSPDDIERKKKIEEDRINELLKNEITDWNHIRGEKQQTTMISMYVVKIGNKYNLDLLERKGLMQKIKLGILAGYFNNQNIELENNQIKHIDGLEFDETTKQFNICHTNIVTKIQKKVIADTTLHSSYDVADTQSNCKRSLIKLWQKYLKDNNRL